jgi:hypothetical protein
MRSFLVILSFLFSQIMFSQEAGFENEKAFGLDPLLYNGKKYTYFLPSGTGGHQFLVSPEYLKGSVTIKGKTYTDLELNYDIFNQELLIRYRNETGATSILEVSEAWLESFSLGDSRFEYIHHENDAGIYQVLGSGSVRILYTWKKELKLETGTNPARYNFTLPKRATSLEIDNTVVPFRSRGSLIKIFPPECNEMIKDYLQQHKIRIKSSSDQSMSRLADFLNGLSCKP